MAEIAALVARFGLAGLLNTAVGFAVIAGLDLGLGVQPALANAAGYAVGVVLGFALNRRFVFRSQADLRATGPKYLVSVAVAFLLNQAVLFLAGAALGPGKAAHLMAQLAGMATYTAAVFLACRFWVFAGPRPLRETA